MNTDNKTKGGVAVQERRSGRAPAWPFEPYFERLMRGFPARPFRAWPRHWAAEEWLPDIDVLEREGKIVVRADLPGMKREDIQVTVERDLLTIKGHRKEEQEVKEEDYYFSERSTGEFSRTLRLPEGIGVEAIEATYEDGVLEVIVPRPAAPEPKAKTVPVK